MYSLKIHKHTNIRLQKISTHENDYKGKIINIIIKSFIFNAIISEKKLKEWQPIGTWQDFLKKYSCYCGFAY